MSTIVENNTITSDPGVGIEVKPPPASPDPSPTPTPAPVVADWRAGLPEELRADKSLESFKDVASLAKSYIETKRMVGQRAEIRPLTKDATPEQVAAWRKALGVPEKPEGYLQAGVTRPESAASGNWDERAEGEFLALMHQHHAQPGAVNAALQFYARMESDKQAGQRNEALAAAQELRREWGPNFDANLGRANRAIQEFGGEPLVDLFTSSGMGRHPLVVKAFASIGTALVESGAMTPEGLAGGMSPDEARVKYNANREEMKKLPEGSTRTREIIDEQIALTRIMNGRR